MNPLVALEDRIDRNISSGGVRKNPWTCIHCGKVAGEGYMVHDSVWNKAVAGGKKAGMLHLRCLEVRLGRSLRLSDFTDAPINESIRWAYQLGLRS